MILKKTTWIFVLVLVSGLISFNWHSFSSLLDSSHSQRALSDSAPFYVHYSNIHPGQLRYSSRNVKEKVNELIKKEKVKWNDDKQRWELKYEEGKSALAKEESLPVVKASFGYVLADGHHDVLSNLEVGSEWIPIRVIKDLSSLSVNRFWNEVESEGWVYLYDLKGERVIPPKNFDSLVDDPNRYFAAITARKYKIDRLLENSVGAEYPLWIKIGKDIPFIEFMISDVMIKHQLYYQYEMGDHPPVEFVEQVRTLLKEKAPVGLKVIPERKHYSKIEIGS